MNIESETIYFAVFFGAALVFNAAMFGRYLAMRDKTYSTLEFRKSVMKSMERIEEYLIRIERKNEKFK